MYCIIYTRRSKCTRIQFEAARSLDSFDPAVFLNFTFASSFNKMMEIEQKLPNVSTAKGTIFESVDVPVALASSCGNFCIFLTLF